MEAGCQQYSHTVYARSVEGKRMMVQRGSSGRRSRICPAKQSLQQQLLLFCCLLLPAADLPSPSKYPPTPTHIYIFTFWEGPPLVGGIPHRSLHPFFPVLNLYT